MRSARQVERLLLIIAGLFLILDVFAVAVLLSPSGRSRQAREDEYGNLRALLAKKKADALPSNEVGAKLVTAHQQISDFYRTRLPQSYADISKTLGARATEEKVNLIAVRYDTKAVNPNLTRVTIGLDVAGNYTDVVKYVNALEREKMMLLLEQINFGGREGNSAMLRVSMTLETYLSTATDNSATADQQAKAFAPSLRSTTSVGTGSAAL